MFIPGHMRNECFGWGFQMDTSGDGVISLKEFTDVLLSRWDAMEISRHQAEMRQSGVVSVGYNCVFYLLKQIIFFETAR